MNSVGFIMGVISRAQNKTWKECVEVGVAVGALYLILSALLTIVGSGTISSILSTLGITITAGSTLMLIIMAFVLGIVDTVIGAAVYDVIRDISAMIKL